MLTDLLNRFGYLFRRSRFESDLDAELKFHLKSRAAELCHHPRPAHRPPPGIRDLAHVNSTGHVGLAVTKQERDLVHALPGEQRPRGHGVAG